MDLNVLFNMFYGPQGWEEVNGWDDVVPLERRKGNGLLVKEFDKFQKCPYLDHLGSCFVYCKAKTIELIAKGIYQSTEKPSLDSAQYHSQVDLYELQLWCLASEQERVNCINHQFAKKNEIG